MEASEELFTDANRPAHNETESIRSNNEITFLIKRKKQNSKIKDKQNVVEVTLIAHFPNAALNFDWLFSAKTKKLQMEKNYKKKVEVVTYSSKSAVDSPDFHISTPKLDVTYIQYQTMLQMDNVCYYLAVGRKICQYFRHHHSS